MHFAGLRQLFLRLPMNHLWLAGRAVQIIDWDRTHQFCSRCATPNEILGHERAKNAPTAVSPPTRASPRRSLCEWIG